MKAWPRAIAFEAGQDDSINFGQSDVLARVVDCWIGCASPLNSHTGLVELSGCRGDQVELANILIFELQIFAGNRRRR